MGLSRDAILAAAKPRIERVELPEWGGEVYVREMTALDRDHFDRVLLDNFDMRRAKAFVLCVCDENGNRLFSDQDIAAVQQFPASAVDRCCDVIWRFAGLSGMEAEKNSEGPSAG